MEDNNNVNPNQENESPVNNLTLEPEVVTEQHAEVPVPAAPVGEPKSKLVAGLLGILLGGFGVHNFYLGNTSRAVIQIIVTLVTCGLGGWWGIIEGIMILCGSINTDANGNPLKD